MSQSFYVPGEERAAKVNELFAGIARRYDRLNDLQSFGLHRRWKRRLIQMAGPRPGLRALDVCCGTGDLTLALAQAGAETVGLDFSEAMLDVAAARTARAAARRGFKAPQFLRGDALQLPFEEGSFDIVTVGYGLRNLASWEAGVREMQRVAKAGGRLGVLDFGKPDNPLWRGLCFGYLRLVVPCLGRVFAGSAGAYAYILESLTHYPAPAEMADRLQRLGLANVQVTLFLGGAMAIHTAEKQ